MVEPHYDDFPLRRQGVRHFDENVKVGQFLVPVTTTATTTKIGRRSGLEGGCDTTTTFHYDEKIVRMWGTKWQTDAGYPQGKFPTVRECVTSLVVGCRLWVVEGCCGGGLRRGVYTVRRCGQRGGATLRRKDVF